MGADFPRMDTEPPDVDFTLATGAIKVCPIRVHPWEIRAHPCSC